MEQGSFNFEQSLIERIACKDEVDREILRFVFEAGYKECSSCGRYGFWVYCADYLCYEVVGAVRDIISTVRFRLTLNHR